MNRLIACIALFCASCASAAVASVTSPGLGFVKYDGDILVARGWVNIAAEVYTKGTWFPIFEPKIVTDGKTYVRIASIDFEETYDSVHDPLPSLVAVLFRPGEAESLGVTFADDAVVIDPTQEE